MATSNNEWEPDRQNGHGASALGHNEPISPRPNKPGNPTNPGSRPGAGSGTGNEGPGGGPAVPGQAKPGRPGPKPNRPDRPDAPRPDRPDAPTLDRPGPRPDPSTAAHLTRFEGMRVKLRKTSAGRYALAVDVELGLDGARAGLPVPEDETDGESGQAGPAGRARAFARGGGDDLDSFAADEGDDVFPVDDDDEQARFAGDASDDDDAGLAADDEGEEWVDDGAEGDGEDMFAAEDEGDDDDAFSAEGDLDELAAGDDDSFAEGDDLGEREMAFAADQGEGEAAAARWPNRLPVRKGIAAISQAPAIFDEPGDDEDDEDDEADEDQDADADAGDREARAQVSPMAARAARARPAPPGPAPARPAPPRPAPARPASPRPARLSAVNRMLAAARRTIGMGERPPGSNHNKITEWYNKHIARIGNGPWCNMAVTYWAGRSKNLPAIFAGKGIGYAYTVAHAQKFKQKGRWRTGTAGIKPGDIVFFDWRGSRSIQNIDHVGVVERVKGKNIITIEGNTTGDSCRRMVRDARYIAGYGRPVYRK